jgi:hypothetical protein
MKSFIVLISIINQIALCLKEFRLTQIKRLTIPTKTHAHAFNDSATVVPIDACISHAIL